MQNFRQKYVWWYFHCLNYTAIDKRGKEQDWIELRCWDATGTNPCHTLLITKNILTQVQWRPTDLYLRCHRLTKPDSIRKGSHYPLRWCHAGINLPNMLTVFVDKDWLQSKRTLAQAWCANVLVDAFVLQQQDARHVIMDPVVKELMHCVVLQLKYEVSLLQKQILKKDV